MIGPMLLRARRVLPLAGPPLEDGAVVVRAGRIHAVGPAKRLLADHPEERERDLGEVALLPGFVNAHSHLEITVLRGFLEDLDFYPWLRRLVELCRDGLKADEHVFHSLLGAAEMLRAGVTCVGDCTSTGAPFDALLVSGLRGVVFQEAFGPTPALAAEALPALADRLDALLAMASDRVRPGLSPHSPYLACPEMLAGCAALAAGRGLPTSIHLAESEAEAAYVERGEGPFAALHAQRGWPVEARGASAVAHVASLGWLALPGPTQLVHLARASGADLALLARARNEGSRLGLVACPRSNAKLGNGLPALSDWDRLELPWGLGTDGAPAVGSCDPFSEMRFALLAERGRTGRAEALSCEAVLRRATVDAARTLGLDGELGTLEPGKQADLCAVALEGPRHVPAADPYSSIVLNAAPTDVRLTLVAGEVVFDGERVVTIDEERVTARCRERAALLASAFRAR